MIAELQASGFRNLADSPLLPGPGRHLVLGPNGAGKTSLIEAMYVVATTRSFRTADLARCRRHGARDFRIEARVEAARIGRLQVALGEHGLERRVDGSRTTLSEHLGVLPVVSFSEADREVLAGAPAARRRFLDRGMVAERPALIETLSRYRQALAAKRAVLMRGGSDLAAWDALLAHEGARLVAARRRHLERVRRELEQLLEVADMEATVDLSYRPNPVGLAEAEDAELEEKILGHLESIRQRELEQQRTLAGAHRDRVVISWQGADVAGAASAGERKLCGWMLTLARARVIARGGRMPLVLFDDADAELDPSRLALAWSLVAEGLDLFATSSRPEVWEGLERERTWMLRGGRVEET